MSDERELVPSPPVVWERLAKNIKERRVLRALLRVSLGPELESSSPPPLSEHIKPRQSAPDQGGER